MNRSRLPAIALLTTVVAAGLTTSATATSGVRTVSYHGYQVSVPVDWQVVDLSAKPDTCVRFDRPAIYLGHPGDQSTCPAGLIGRTAAIVVEPLDSRVAVLPGVQAAPPGKATAPSGTPSANGEIQLAVQDAGVMVTAAHGAEHESTVRSVLATARLTKGGQPARLVRPSRVGPAVTAIAAPGALLGQAFDACTAPSQGAMNAWRSSPFRAVGIYISGGVRACGQPNLTPTWVSTNYANGWQFILIDVGRQAPCSSFSTKISLDPATARQQGRDAAAGSATAATNLGFGAGSAIYSDIEGYASNPGCRAAVLSYVSGWTQELNARGFLGGVYSSAASGIRDLSSAYNDPAYTRPDHIWFAWWNGRADVDGGQYVPAHQWANHQRLHQYRGGHNETWGGVTINIDSNYLDVGQPAPLPDGVYRIKAEVGGHDLDVTDCHTEDGSDIRIWYRILGSPCQRWAVTAVEPGVYKIIDSNSGKAVDVAGCSTADRAIVHLWPYWGGSCQTWRIDAIGTGVYKIIGVGSGKSLDVAGCSPAAGADVIIWPFHGGSCQRWYFDPV